MSAPEFTAKQGDSGSLIQQAITFDFATNLTGAEAQFIYKTADGLVVRPAVLVSSTPIAGAATSATLKRILSTADVTVEGYYPFEWRIVLADGSPITRPKVPDDSENPGRSHQVFQVVPALYDGETEETEDGVSVIASRFMVLDTLAELAALPWSESYSFAKVQFDATGASAEFWWDATIVSADAEENSVVPLTALQGGGWRRSTL